MDHMSICESPVSIESNEQPRYDKRSPPQMRDIDIAIERTNIQIRKIDQVIMNFFYPDKILMFN